MQILKMHLNFNFSSKLVLDAVLSELRLEENLRLVRRV